MATDYCGNDISVGDTVTKVGSSSEFVVVAETNGIWGNTLLTLEGNWEERGVDPENVIKTG